MNKEIPRPWNSKDYSNLRDLYADFVVWAKAKLDDASDMDSYSFADEMMKIVQEWLDSSR